MDRVGPTDEHEPAGASATAGAGVDEELEAVGVDRLHEREVHADLGDVGGLDAPELVLQLPDGADVEFADRLEEVRTPFTLGVDRQPRGGWRALLGTRMSVRPSHLCRLRSNVVTCGGHP
jgi:hypothetical protein